MSFHFYCNPMGDSPKINGNRDTSFYLGRLMSPTEVAKSTQDQPKAVQRRVSGSWCLCGDISSEMFGILRGASLNEVAFRLTGFCSPYGGGYAVFTHQLQGFQHRFLTCLYDPTVRACLESLRTSPLPFSLGNNGAREAVVVDTEVPAASYEPLIGFCELVEAGSAFDTARELPIVLTEMTHPLRIASLEPDYRVKEVSLTFLPPDRSLVPSRMRTTS